MQRPGSPITPSLGRRACSPGGRRCVLLRHQQPSRLGQFLCVFRDAATVLMVPVPARIFSGTWAWRSLKVTEQVSFSGVSRCVRPCIWAQQGGWDTERRDYSA